MELIGKRCPWYAEYEVGFDSSGKLLGIKINYYVDVGCSPNDNDIVAYFDFYDNVYNCENWHLVPYTVKTNTAANTWTRSPGTFPCLSVIEHIVEHVAKHLNIDPFQVRMLNMYKKGQVTPRGHSLDNFIVDEIVKKLLTTSDYNKRLNDVKLFNIKNRWKKRGISLVPLKWVNYSMIISL